MEQLKVLVLEDVENDFELIKIELIDSLEYDFILKWVMTKEEFLAAMNDFDPDIILSDFKLPQFSGLEALKLATEKKSLIPFIIVTGSLTEEVAAESIIMGAWDYVVKERLHRLPQAVENALKLKRERLKSYKAEEELKFIKEQTGIRIKLLHDAINHAPHSVMITDNTGMIVYVNPKFTEITGYSLLETVGNNPRFLKSGKHDDNFYKNLWSTILSGKEWTGEMINRKKNGDLLWEQVSISPITDENNIIVNFVANLNDISEIKDKEDKLRSSDTWYKALFSNTGTATCILEDDGIISLANPKSVELSGYTIEEIEGKMKWFDFVDIDDYAKMRKYFDERKMIGDNISELQEFIFIDKNGIKKNVLSRINNIHGTNKFITSMLDITDRKRFEAALETERILLRTVIENIPDAIYVKDRRLKKVLVNKADLDNFGRPESEVLGKDDFELLPPEVAKNTYRDDEHVVNTGEAILNKEEFITNTSGKNKWLLTSKLPLYDKEGKITGLVGIGHDITEIKKMIEELVKAKEKAEEMNRLKSIFLANMSHELRTPLVGLLGFSEVLCNELTGELKDYAEMISASGERLLRTLSVLLDYSKIEAEKVELTKRIFSLTNLLDDEIKLYAVMAKNKAIKLQSEYPAGQLLINSDDILLKEIIDNLLNNALKYTSKGSVVIKTETGNDTITIKVVDTGIGIPKEKISRIFEEFRQVSEGANRSYQGTGLGLTLVKKYVTLLGGRIEVESEVGAGSTFSILFPLDIISNSKVKPKANVPVKAPETTAVFLQQRHRNLLLVEDDRICELAIKKMLSDLVSIDSVSNAMDAIKAAATIQYDAVLMDINLGEGMSGIEAAREIKKDPQYKNKPIIAITAYAMDKEKEDFLNSGCTHYIAKPFKKQVLLDLLNDVFKN
jgi:PAS domain S-box-containing protein